ncbi:MAG TPA: DUF58 domain-containing protein [Candidatus Thermoplasmatota archaeon]|nr:DUF58 domain-containing protein [Candidatus Thermoplasmatota archaeon]
MKLTALGLRVSRAAAVLVGGGLVLGVSAALWAGMALLLLLGVSALALPRARIAVERKLDREQLVEGEGLKERLEVTLKGRRTVRLRLRESAGDGLASEAAAWTTRLSPKAPHAREIEWTASSWGRKSIGPLEAWAGDAFGLLEERVEGDEGHAVLVLPRALPLGKHRPKASIPQPAIGVHNVPRPGDGFEFFALRDYQPGDSIRRINWKASARYNKTVVNQVTRESFARVTILLDLRAKEILGDPRPWVLNGRAAASILEHHDRMRDHLTVIVLGDVAEKLVEAANPRSADLVKAMVERPPRGHVATTDAVRGHLPSFRRKSPTYVVTSAVFDPDLIESIEILRALEADVHLVSPRADHEPVGPAGRLLAESRNEALAAARALGVKVTDWSGSSSLEVAFIES